MLSPPPPIGRFCRRASLAGDEIRKGVVCQLARAGPGRDRKSEQQDQPLSAADQARANAGSSRVKFQTIKSCYHKAEFLWALRSFGTDGLYPRFAGTEPLRVSAVPVTIP
jgi:hypothetical protein